LGRLYKTVKQNPVLNLKQFQTDNGDRELKLSSRSGSDATARAIAEQVGVGQATVRRAEKFADAVEALQEVSPEAAERVLRGEVRDAFVANGQNPAAFSRQGGRSGALFAGGA
jgi:aspartokinase